VLEILICDVAVVQECGVRVGGLGLLPKREGKCREPQHPEPAGMSPASRITVRDLRGGAGRAPNLAGTGRGLNVADVGNRGRSGLTFVPCLGVGPDEHGETPSATYLVRFLMGRLCPAHEVYKSRCCQPGGQPPRVPTSR
jgi:hypothetical protein